MARVPRIGQVPAVNKAMESWVNNSDPLPGDLPAEVVAHLQRANRLPSWADQDKLRRAADFNRRTDTYRFMLYGVGSGITSTVIPREAKAVYWSAGRPGHVPQPRDLRAQEADRMAVPMSVEDEEAFLHMWQVAIHLLGVREEFIPKTWADADAHSDQVLTPMIAPTTTPITLPTGNRPGA